MRALLMVLGVAVGACSDGATGGKVGDVSPDARRAELDNVAACPAADAFLTPTFPMRCGEGAAGVACRYTAFACDPGEKPDNVCRCAPDGLVCEGHLRSCLPLVDGGSYLSAQGRPRPRRREAATACVDPANIARDATCTPQYNQGPDPECGASSECESDEACLQQHTFGAGSTCKCIAASCLSDADCGAKALCNCGANDPTTACDGPYYRTSCTNRCVPAQCNSDADCRGGTCSPSPDQCNSGYDRWACHDETRDECLSDAECALSADGSACRYVDDGWRCTSGPLCD